MILQFVEFAFGIGSILAPVIMQPYLVGEIGTGNVGRDTFGDDQGVSAEERRSRLMWPTLITGACLLPSKFYFLKLNKTSKKVMLNDSKREIQ